MQTVRFTQVVEQSGQPEVYLLFTKPEADAAFQQALKTHRIMTVHGTAKTDFGSVGYAAGGHSQILIFPKSLKTFSGKNVVGIKYDLFHLETERKPAASKAQKEAPPKAAAKPLHQKPPKAGPPRSSKMETGKVVAFPKPEPPDESHEESDESSEIKAKVRRALKALEDGKQVAAFNILKTILDV